MPNGKSTSYFYAIFSIMLVLLVMGIAAVIVIEAQRVSNNFKENMVVELVVKDDLTAQSIDSLQQKVKATRFIKESKIISKEEAALILQKDLGEDFLDVLGYNPLYTSMQINLRSNYANQDSMDLVRATLLRLEGVKQVNMQSNVLESLDRKVRGASIIILLVGAALLIFSVSLIFNTIRLVMFSRRFIIKTMQLFGATRWFIIRPFLGRSIVNGIASGLIACGILAIVIFYFDYTLPELGLKADLYTFALLFGVIILFGILISFLSTLTALFRYLRVKVEDLY
ncbi:MAG: cell division protein FtsX [Bacteroidetes bacterium]|nr:cell division protein FtsX [Bacteroidota bacterium]